MFKQNVKSLYQSAMKSPNLSSFAKRPGVSNRQMSEFYKLSLLRQTKTLPNILRKPNNMNSFLNHFAPKRGFSSNFERFLNNMLNKLPQGNIAYLIVFLNSLIYGMYLFWPRHQMYSFLNNFTFSKYNLSRGYLQTFFTCHFSHMSFFTYLLDSVIIFLFCQNISMMHGPVYLAKIVLLSMFMGSFFLFLQQSAS